MNIQKSILEGIRSSLLAHDYLVLPEFGGFVLKSRFAHFDTAGGNLLPPSKTLSFNIHLKQNDGILATCLQNDLQCNASEALIHLKEFSAYCLGVLHQRRRLSLEGIGFFFMDFENNICFEPQIDVNFETASFGLGPVQLKPLTLSVKEEVREFTFEDRPLKESEKVITKSKSKRNYRPLILPLSLLLLVFIFLSTLVSNKIISGSLAAGMNEQSKQGLYQLKVYSPLHLEKKNSDELVYVTDANGFASIGLVDGKSMIVQVNTKIVDETSTGLSKGKYEIVLGCFSKLENAKRLVQRLRAGHLNAGIHGQNAKGMHIVSLGNYANHDLALAELSTLKDSYSHAWIRSGN
jgi:hypothetical protein